MRRRGRRPPGHGGQDRVVGVRHQRREAGIDVADLAVEVVQQRQIGGQDLSGHRRLGGR